MSSGTKVVNNIVSSTSTKLSRSSSLSKAQAKTASKAKLSRTPSTKSSSKTPSKSPSAKSPIANANKQLKQPPAKQKQPTQQKKKASKKAETSSPKEENKIQIVITKDDSTKKTSKQKKQPSPRLEPTNLLLQKSLKQEPRGRRRSSSAIEVRKNTTIYAGPTFNNAPAPSAIPIPPAFSPTLLSMDLMKKEQQEEYLNLEKESQNLMSQYAHQHHYQNHAHYFYNQLHNHHFHQYYPYDKDLSEIQRDLRSLLKI